MKPDALAIALAALSGAAAVSAASEAKTWQLSFWIEGDVEDVAESDIFTHPCGATVLLSVSQIPIGRPNIDTEKVVEFDSVGAVIREWRTPVDSPPVALDGDRLIVSDWVDGRPIFLAIDPAGRIADFAIALEQPADAGLQCPPSVASEFGDSAYLRCERWVDRSSEAQRLIAYEGPCT